MVPIDNYHSVIVIDSGCLADRDDHTAEITDLCKLNALVKSPPRSKACTCPGLRRMLRISLAMSIAAGVSSLHIIFSGRVRESEHSTAVYSA